VTTLLHSSDAATGRPGQLQVELLRRLLSARTISAVTQAAVDGVRALVSADVSWCGLINGEYLTMAAYSGLRTAEMPALWQLRVGQGVGGRVASEGRTIAVRDYRHDPRRVPVMKRLIDAEDIRGGVCAPLLGGSDVLGVLYASHRSPREWTPDEVGLVTDAARDAGVALALIYEQRRDQAELDDARERARDAARALQAGTATAADLARTEDIGAGIGVLAHHLRMHVELLDAGGELLRAASPGTRQVEQIQLVRPVGDEPLGTLRIRGERPPREPELELVELCSHLVALQLLRERAAMRSELRLQSEFVDDLLAGRLHDRTAMLTRAAVLGVDLHTRHQVVRFGRCGGAAGATPAVPRRTLALLETEIAREFPRSIVVPHHGDVLAMLAIDELEPARVLTVLRAIVRTASDTAGGLVAGVGRTCSGLGDLPDSGAEASIALDLARGRDEPGTVVSGSDLGFYGLLARGAARHSLASIVERALGPILEADAAGGSDYVRTLAAFLSNDRHLERTAGCLHVHPNTVRYRLAKVQELLGVNLRDVDDRFLLELALRVRAALPDR
jgi:sugar diacid utilization regulator/putative methionine-R-sulfoxide reductase with GAF domain